MLAVAPPMLLPFLRHWKLGEGVPVTEIENDTPDSAQTVWLDGWPVIDGPTLTVSEAALLVALPQALVTTQS